MNICIITVYNTENCGSFWQAYALANILEQKGHNVSFLYNSLKRTSQSFKGHLREFVIKSVKLDFTAAVFVWKKSENFKKAQKSFKTIAENSPEFKKTDLFVLGSDTIWNFASPYFAKYKEKYTGGRFGPGKCIAYAASAANTTYDFFANDKSVKSNIENLKAVSVRDTETYEIVKKLTGQEASIVCDPTMLTEHSLFDKNAKDIKDKNYILLYHFGKVSEHIKNEILELKEKYNLKVISFAEHRAWCDKSVCCDPYMFVSYFKNADFVITNTFHGTIFSILYEKNFAEYGNNKKKISDLLKLLHLTDAVADEKPLTEIFSHGPDYGYAAEKIKEIRTNSMLYLEKNITEK